MVWWWFCLLSLLQVLLYEFFQKLFVLLEFSTHFFGDQLSARLFNISALYSVIFSISTMLLTCWFKLYWLFGTILHAPEIMNTVIIIIFFNFCFYRLHLVIIKVLKNFTFFPFSRRVPNACLYHKPSCSYSNHLHNSKWMSFTTQSCVFYFASELICRIFLLYHWLFHFFIRKRDVRYSTMLSIFNWIYFILIHALWYY